MICYAPSKYVVSPDMSLMSLSDNNMIEIVGFIIWLRVVKFHSQFVQYSYCVYVYIYIHINAYICTCI